MRARRVLVTGAAGRLGGEVVRLLAAAGWSVTGLIAPGDDAAPIDGFADRVVRGNAADPDVATRAVTGADAVAHLAAIPSPSLGPPHVVFGQNTLATFCVLDAATRAGIGVAVVASSLAASGLAFSPHDAAPAYLPLDEQLPSQVADPYALSKTTDEATAEMMSRRSGITTTALRLPYLGTPADRLPEHAEFLTTRPDQGSRDGWSYLDTRDAARAVARALDRSGGDSIVVGVAAPVTLTPYPTEALIDAFLPGVPRRRTFAGREVPLDLTRAEKILGFFAEHVWQLPDQPLPDVAEIRRRPVRPV
ncbi:MAG: hypothetical protein QOG49_1527 [Frankiaceae bacterium]|jgi:nucleoside-diphosphate-sugar epimerase|nr:hypothetical protein [Frankiaceae bacterium]